jgi:hypothetical protein
MKIEEIKRRLIVLKEQQSRIDYAIQILEDKLLAEKDVSDKSNEIQIIQPAPNKGSYVLQKVKCGKPTCHCAKPGGELHGPYWHHYVKKNGKTLCKYIGKNKPK